MAGSRSDEASPSGEVELTASRAAVGIIVVLLALAGVVWMTSGGTPGTAARVGPAVVDLPAGRQALATPLPAAEPTGLRIPSIGVDVSSVASLGLNEDRSLQVPSQARTVGWYDRGASPGETGPAVFASHVNYRGVEGGFARLAEVRAGDQVIVTRADRTTAVFVVDRVDQVSKRAFPTEDVYGPTPSPEIRLITCGGTFDPGVRSYEDNVVVHGHLSEAFRT